MKIRWLFILLVLLSAGLYAGVVGSIGGIIRDPQGLPVVSAEVMIVDKIGGKSLRTITDAAGHYEFGFVELGTYNLNVDHPDFMAEAESVTLRTSEKTTVDISFKQVRGPAAEVTVGATASRGEDRSPTTQVLLSKNDFERTAGGSDTINALVSKTGGAVVSQEHLHIRGAHQVGIEVNGVILPDLSLFGALTPFVNPKDVRYAEVTTGGLPAEFGNRTGGILNLITHSGSENHTKKGRIELSGGNLGGAGTFFSYGDTVKDKFSYYFSADALTSNRGINPPPLGEDLAQPPNRQTVHNHRRTYRNLGVFDYKLNDTDNLNFTVGGFRSNFQIPNTLHQQNVGRDYNQFERDHFQNLRWSRTIGANKLLEVSFYHHFNKVEVGGRRDDPFVAIDNRRVDYYGTRVDFATKLRNHFLKIGGEISFANLRDDFTILPTTSGPHFETFRSRVPVLGKQQSFYIHDQVNLTENLTFNLGLRFDAFQAKRSDMHLSPRIGVSYRIPDTQLVVFGSFARMFLPPPIEFFDLQGQAAGLTSEAPRVGRFSEDFAFIPTRPEIDTQYEVGVKFPFHGYRLKVAHWYKRQHHFLDHKQLEHPSGDVNIFLPVNLERGRSFGIETAVESPSLKGLTFYVNHFFGYAQAKGASTGGLIDLTERPAPKYFFLDHDQRHTLSVGANYELEQFKAWINGAVRFGSGFPDASGTFARERLPRHSTMDLTFGKKLFDQWDFRVELANLTNKVYPINLSSEFNGTHYSVPRLVTFRLRYNF